MLQDRFKNPITHSQVKSSTKYDNKYIFLVKDQLQTTIKILNHTFIYGIFTNQTFNASYLYYVFRASFSWVVFLVRVEVELGYWCELLGGNPKVDFNKIDNYAMHTMILSNIETRKTEPNIISGK